MHKMYQIGPIDKNRQKLTKIDKKNWLTFNFFLLSRSKTAKTPTNAVRVINVAAELAAKKNTTMSLPNYHAFLT